MQEYKIFQQVLAQLRELNMYRFYVMESWYPKFKYLLKTTEQNNKTMASK